MKAVISGKVRLYSIGYLNAYTCSDLDKWKSDNGFTHPVFTGGSSEVQYYGGMGMPTVVVTAGADHKVYYKKQGYFASQDAAIKTALDDALNATAIYTQQTGSGMISIYPNPAGNTLTLQSRDVRTAEVTLYDMHGRRVLGQQ